MSDSQVDRVMAGVTQEAYTAASNETTDADIYATRASCYFTHLRACVETLVPFAELGCEDPIKVLTPLGKEFSPCGECSGCRAAALLARLERGEG